MGHEQGYKTDRTRDVWALENPRSPTAQLYTEGAGLSLLSLCRHDPCPSGSGDPFPGNQSLL